MFTEYGKQEDVSWRIWGLMHLCNMKFGQWVLLLYSIVHWFNAMVKNSGIWPKIWSFISNCVSDVEEHPDTVWFTISPSETNSE
jgi:hypothetical protein